jgi:hypothetical protein
MPPSPSLLWIRRLRKWLPGRNDVDIFWFILSIPSKIYECFSIIYPMIRKYSITFNRRVHALSDWLAFSLDILTELVWENEVFIIDSMPVPVCKRKRARRCRKVRGRAYCGYCAAKDEKFFGWRLHLICTADGCPASFTLLPAAFHDLTPLYELTVDLPPGATLYGDKAYNCAEVEQFLAHDGLALIPIRKKNMEQHTLQDENNLRRYRKGVETVNSQLESMGINRLRTRTNPGFEIKVHASLIALWNTRFLASENEQSR